MRIIKFTDPDFTQQVDRLVHRLHVDFSGPEGAVREIVLDVKENGDAALLKYTNRFDRNRFSIADLRVGPDEIAQAYEKVKPEELAALRTAETNVRKFHARQVQSSWNYREGDVLLGQMVRPLEMVGIYVPGGKASYPSSVLMNAIPARVAGVGKIVMCSPAPDGLTSPHALVAADVAGVDEIYKIGGAQAVAALAFGNTCVPRVDKIVGPGNIYVALAKRMVFGVVGIDMIAGPSEILIVADATARPDFLAADLLSQAEHDEEAVPVLITPSESLAQAVAGELERQNGKLKRQAITRVSLANECRLFVVKNLEDAILLADRAAPEHLELAVENAAGWAEKIHNAGAIFLGQYTPEALGDYLAGPNHVLPTSGTARFSSPLGVYDFIKRTSLIGYTREALHQVAREVGILAEMEQLDAHAAAVRIRL